MALLASFHGERFPCQESRSEDAHGISMDSDQQPWDLRNLSGQTLVVDIEL